MDTIKAKMVSIEGIEFSVTEEVLNLFGNFRYMLEDDQSQEAQQILIPKCYAKCEILAGIMKIAEYVVDNQGTDFHTDKVTEEEKQKVENTFYNYFIQDLDLLPKVEGLASYLGSQKILEVAELIPILQWGKLNLIKM